MLNRLPSTNGRRPTTWLTRPYCGSSSRIQPKVSGSSGRKMPSQHSTSITERPGMSLRAISQATLMAMGSEMAVRTAPSATLFQSARSVVGSENACTQLARP